MSNETQVTTTNPQETLEPKLKRCPFCGGLAIKGMFNVWCDNCRAQTARDVDVTEAEVIEQWNTRVRDSTAATMDSHAQNPDAFCLACNEHPCRLIAPSPVALRDEAKCVHCDPSFVPTGPDDWCPCRCHNTGEF